ncbi:GNAT family N-acetyltransferase [Aliikangiella sp. IMCC44359]|uniref:GNAT family N-acetyltransferase n=1 Tax=Aliikangiella sp. IMCC44359 TaxID=3459125 RepID=UPI00403AE84E
MNSSIVIRKAKLSELSTLLEFEQSIIEYERPFEENMMAEHFNYYDLAELIQSDIAEVLVAVDNGRLVGSGYAIIKDSRHYLKHKQHAYLGFMYIDPDYRGQGINQMLVKRLVEWSKKKNMQMVCLTVFSENDSAITAYKKAGFHSNLIEMRLNLEE